MIIRASDRTSTIANSTPSFSVGKEKTNDQKSLMMLVTLASSLFDQQAALEEKWQARDTKDTCNPPQQQQCQRQESSPPSSASFQRQTNTEVVRKTPAANKIEPKNILKVGANKKSNKKQHVLPQTSNFQCCTREGFLSKLFAVLNDESHSHVLSWMPDGKAFTIISSREFSKSGLVYDLFGIRKMSSFLRRLNQLGFARIRDPTDPNNLDVFRKEGFVAPKLAGKTKEKVVDQNQAESSTKKDVPNRMESPTSTIMFQPTIEKVTEKSDNGSSISPLNPPSSSLPSFAPIPTRTSTHQNLSTRQSQNNTKVGVSGASSYPSSTKLSWVCSTPGPVQTSQNYPVIVGHSYSAGKGVSRNPLFLRTQAPMPPSIPMYPSAGPVLLRARSESFERPKPQPMILVKPALIPAAMATNKLPLELSPGTVETLKFPNLRSASR